MTRPGSRVCKFRLTSAGVELGDKVQITARTDCVTCMIDNSVRLLAHVCIPCCWCMVSCVAPLFCVLGLRKGVHKQHLALHTPNVAHLFPSPARRKVGQHGMPCTHNEGASHLLASEGSLCDVHDSQIIQATCICLHFLLLVHGILCCPTFLHTGDGKRFAEVRM